jgi:hypothetical protein
MSPEHPSPDELLARPPASAHMVQLCSDSAALAQTVTHYLSDGFRCGDSAAVIATRDHWNDFDKGLQDRGLDPKRMEREGRLAVLDARATLDSFMRGGMPDETLFHQAVRPVLSTLSSSDGTTIRAYGEMVSLLWSDRRFDAAIRLEELWNGLAETCSFVLFCAYHGDALAPEFHGRQAETVYGQHSHVVGAADYERLSRAVQQAMEEVFGKAEAAALRPLIAATKRRAPTLPGAQATLLWLQSNLPDRVDAVLAAARRLNTPADRK